MSASASAPGCCLPHDLDAHTSCDVLDRLGPQQMSVEDYGRMPTARLKKANLRATGFYGN
jgi:hypothetical protein